MVKIIPVGCTAVHTFIYPYSEAETAVIYITYKQKFGIAAEKSKEDIRFMGEDKIIAYLTQTDTLKFKENEPVEIQIRARLTDGRVIKSNIVKASTDKLLKKGEI